MNDVFTSDFFKTNRQQLRELFTGKAPIVITANGLLQRGGDSSYAFAQDAHFWYLTGIDEPDITLVMDKTKDYLIVPGRGANRVAFDGSVDLDALVRRSGVATVYEDDEGWNQLSARLKRAKHVATVAPAPNYLQDYGMYTNPARAQLVERMQAANTQLEILDIAQHISRLRMVKQSAELQAMRQAIDVTLQTLEEVSAADQLAKYAHEYEIEANISRSFRRLGASGHAFEPIVASGKRACTLHNVANNGPLSSDELVVMDVGAEVSHYAADITRTYSLGTPSRRQQAVYDAVLDVQQYACSLVKPGVLIKDNEAQIEQYMGEKLRDLGLIQEIDHASVRKYFPHATSHFLGLNVHDVGDYSRPLEENVVLTVEPGIYIPEEGIGIRIEDDVLVTAGGYEVLSAALPRALR